MPYFITVSSTLLVFFPMNFRRLAILSQKLQSSYEKTKDLKADFVQEATIKSIKKTEREEGKVFFKNPKNMLWEYTKPQGKKLVINSQKAWLYLSKEKVVYTQKSESIFQSKFLINFFSGSGKLKDDFIIKYAEPKALDKDGNYLLVLTPREKTSACNLVKLTIDKNNFYILQVSFDDVMGNSTTLKFSNISINTGLGAENVPVQASGGSGSFRNALKLFEFIVERIFFVKIGCQFVVVDFLNKDIIKT